MNPRECPSYTFFVVFFGVAILFWSVCMYGAYCYGIASVDIERAITYGYNAGRREASEALENMTIPGAEVHYNGTEYRVFTKEDLDSKLITIDGEAFFLVGQVEYLTLKAQAAESCK